jgi:hypothetical protein
LKALNPNAHVVHVFQVLAMEGSANEGWAEWGRLMGW